MFEPFDRRRFLQLSVGGAVASQWLAWDLLGGEPDLWSYVDPRLRPRTVNLPADENAYPVLIAAAQQITAMPVGDFEIEDLFRLVNPDRDLDQKFSGWLDQNQASLALVQRVLELGKLEYPHEPWTDDRPNHSLRQLAWLMQFWAMRAWARGDAAGAMATTEMMFDVFGLAKSGGVFVEYLIASACQMQACRLVRKFANSAQADTQSLRAMLTKLPNHSSESLSEFVRSEFCCYWFPLIAKAREGELADTLTIFLQYEENSQRRFPREQYDSKCALIGQLMQGHPRPYDQIDTVKRSSKCFVDIIEACGKSWQEHSAEPSVVSFEELAPWPKQLTFWETEGLDPREVSEATITTAREKLREVENPIGKNFVQWGSMSSKLMHSVALSLHARYQGTRLIVALNLYAREHGQLPERLNDLVTAKILDELPIDPFSGQPYQYSRDEKAAWSIGPQGHVTPSTPEDGPGSDDLVWRVE